MGRHKKIKPEEFNKTPLEFVFSTEKELIADDNNFMGKLQLEPIEDVFLDLPDCRMLWIKVIEKAVEDYILLSVMNPKKMTEEQKFNLWTATEFLFNDEYTVDAGGEELNLEEICGTLSSEDLSISNLRRSVKHKLEQKRKKKAENN